MFGSVTPKNARQSLVARASHPRFRGFVPLPVSEFLVPLDWSVPAPPIQQPRVGHQRGRREEKKMVLERRKREDTKDLKKSGMHQLAVKPIFVSFSHPQLSLSGLVAGQLAGNLCIHGCRMAPESLLSLIDCSAQRQPAHDKPRWPLTPSQ